MHPVPPPIQIRRARISDSAQIAELINEHVTSRPASRKYVGFFAYKFKPSDVPAWVKGKHIRAFVATQGNLVQGFICLEHTKEFRSHNEQKLLCKEPVTFCHLIVGRRGLRGIGKLLYKQASDMAREEFGQRLATFVETGPIPNLGSLAFHQAMGFQVVDVYKHKENDDFKNYSSVMLLQNPKWGYLGNSSRVSQHPAFLQARPPAKVTAKRALALSA